MISQKGKQSIILHSLSVFLVLPSALYVREYTVAKSNRSSYKFGILEMIYPSYKITLRVEHQKHLSRIICFRNFSAHTASKLENSCPNPHSINTLVEAV